MRGPWNIFAPDPKGLRTPDLNCHPAASKCLSGDILMRQIKLCQPFHREFKEFMTDFGHGRRKKGF